METFTLRVTAIKDPKFPRHGPQCYFRHLNAYDLNLDKVVIIILFFLLKSWGEKYSWHQGPLKVMEKIHGQKRPRCKDTYRTFWHKGNQLCEKHDETKFSRSYRNLVSVIIFDETYCLSLFLSVLWQEIVFTNCLGYLPGAGIWSSLIVFEFESVHDSNSITRNPMGNHHLLWITLFLCSVLGFLGILVIFMQLKSLWCVNHFTCSSLEESYIIVCVCSLFPLINFSFVEVNIDLFSVVQV